MKEKLFVFILLFLNYTLVSQNYVLDSSFGDSGIKRFGKNINVIKGLLVNDNYFLISNNAMVKINYNGQIVSSFGDNGIKSLQPSNTTSTFTNLVFINNYFYVYGSTKSGNSTNIDIFIAKLDENGNYDNSFGSNGIVILDFGIQEKVTDLVIEPSGTLYCTGTRYQNTPSESNKSLFLFKVNGNGILDTTFNSIGYKEINQNFNTSGGSIIAQDGNYILLGTTTIIDTPYSISKLLLTIVDENGNINNSFGTNGFKTILLGNSNPVNITINDAQLLDNKFYANITYSDPLNTFDALFIFDSESTQTLSLTSIIGRLFHKVTNEGLFMTKYYPCGNISSCNNVFNISKINPNGTLDTTFNNNGSYSYEFNYGGMFPNNGDSQSYVFIKEPNGKFLIAGFVYPSFGTSDFSAIRIVDSSLEINNETMDNEITIYPNPFDNIISLNNISQVKTIEIYDLIGRRIDQPKFYYENNNTTVDLSKINESGNYIIKITTENNEIITKKLIKE
jgi:uncharacterized delta-60 repeat protein